jgi:hypothetical protein
VARKYSELRHKVDRLPRGDRERVRMRARRGLDRQLRERRLLRRQPSE